MKCYMINDVARCTFFSSTFMTLSWRMTRFGDVTAAVDDEMTSVMKGVVRTAFTNVSVVS